MSASVTGNRKLRVLMTADAVGGVWQYALDLAEGLRLQGVETILAVLGPTPSEDQRETAQKAGIELLLTSLPLDWTADAPHEVEEAGRVIARIARDPAPDIVHLNNPALAASAAFEVPVVAVCHSCVATWWQAVRGGPLPDEFVWRTDLLRRGYERADRLLAPTAAFARLTAQSYDLKEIPVVVRNGRRISQIERRASSQPFAFTAGRLWDEGKNLACLDRAASRIAIPVLAAGPLQGPNRVSAAAHHVRALGRLSDAEVARYLAEGPVFVSTARYEPFGLAVLEAAQAGCALILSDIPTLRELWEDAAVFVQPDDDQALAGEIQRLAQESEARRALGEAAALRARTYSVEAMSAGVLSAYRALLPSRTDRSPLEGAAA
ncbi:glycosyltransferase family 4 protein [Microvirga roseola]|uniref:glycosyltransferase family 4 protein n=1 Tax=Microvirga roseola TaxID=2883126 RepID=UPI001E5EABD9|nr:glycosyltransferase family 4 protein [Microvirga roseola]